MAKKKPKLDGGFPEDGGMGGGPTWIPPAPESVQKSAQKPAVKDIFGQRRKEDPQGVIDDLIKQTSRQAAEIHKLNLRIAELEGK